MKPIEENRRILTIDDNPSLQKDYRKILGGTVIESPLLDEDERFIFGQINRTAGNLVFELSSAGQGQEALAKVRTAAAEGLPFAMAFVDIRMPPGWDGVETIARLWEVDPHLEIVICTAYSDYSWGEIQEKLGRPNQLLILKKPFEDIEVLQMARALTDKWNLAWRVRRNTDELERRITDRTQQLEAEILGRANAERQQLLEAERSRLARDLHDELGASLTEMSLLANAGAGNPASLDKASERFHLIANKARQVVDGLDVIVWAVNPATDALQPLADYISGYAREFLAACGIACRLKVPIHLPSITLDSQVRLNLFLAVKETLNNVARHASASEVEFKMDLLDDGLRIEISDNGIGFDPSRANGGMGLTNLRRRLETVGGEFSFAANGDAGTTVHLFLPVAADPAPATVEGGAL